MNFIFFVDLQININFSLALKSFMPVPLQIICSITNLTWFIIWFKVMRTRNSYWTWMQ